MQIFSTDKQVLESARKLSTVLVNDDIEIISCATTSVPSPVVVHALPRILVGDSQVQWHEYADDSVQLTDRVAGGLSPAALGGGELIRYLSQLRGEKNLNIIFFVFWRITDFVLS